MNPLDNPLEEEAAKLRKAKYPVNIGWDDDEGCLLIMIVRPIGEQREAELSKAAALCGLKIDWFGVKKRLKKRLYRIMPVSLEGLMLAMMYRNPKSGELF